VNEQEVYQALNEIFREVFDDPTMEVTPDLSADDVAEWDSFNHINIIVASEQRFGVKFHTAEIESLRNAGEFVALITRKRLAA